MEINRRTRLQRRSSRRRLSSRGLRSRSPRSGRLLNQSQFVLLVRTRQRFWLELQIACIQFQYLIQARTLQHAGRISRVNRERIQDALARNPILVTALNPIIGYEKGAAIAKKAYAEGRPILEVAAEMTKLDIGELRRLLDPMALTSGGVKGSGSSA